MNKRELLELIDLYNMEDEVIFNSPGGKPMRVTTIDHEATYRTGKVTIRTEWMEKEEVEGFTPTTKGALALGMENKIQRIPQQEWVPITECKFKYQVEKRCPWAVVIKKSGDGWMCFESEKDAKKWKIRIDLPDNAYRTYNRKSKNEDTETSNQ